MRPLAAVLALLPLLALLLDACELAVGERELTVAGDAPDAAPAAMSVDGSMLHPVADAGQPAEEAAAPGSDAGELPEVSTDADGAPRDATEEAPVPCDPTGCDTTAAACAQTCAATRMTCAMRCGPGPGMGCMKQCDDLEAQCKQGCAFTCATCVVTSPAGCPQSGGTPGCSMATR